MKRTIIIVDDEQPARKLLEKYIAKIDFLELLGSFKSPLDALTVLKQQKIDILLLDIRMPQMSGLEFLKTLSSPPAIILTTAYREYALEGYEYNITDYLLKPIEFTRFLKAINKVKTTHKKNIKTTVKNELQTSEEYIHLKYNKKNYKIPAHTILYIEGENEYVNYHLNNGKKMLIYGTLKELETKLSSRQFCRIHRSYIVNLNEIEYIEGNRISIQSQKLPISDTYKKPFLKKWNSNLI